MKRYVLGFMFDAGYHNVLLIEKCRPEWQAGKLNGIGGKIEDGETPGQAMEREFREETAGQFDTADHLHRWEAFGRLRGDDWEVWLFHAKIGFEFDVGVGGIETDGETTVVVPREDLPNRLTLPNLRYLVPMAFNHARQLDRAEFLEIWETSPPTQSVGEGVQP